MGALETLRGKYNTQQSQFGPEGATLEELETRLRIEEHLRDKAIEKEMYLHHDGWVKYLTELINQKRR